MDWALAVVSLALLGVAAVSGRITGTPITPAMLFAALGLLVGPQVLAGVDLDSTSSTVRALAEATLALVLFCEHHASISAGFVVSTPSRYGYSALDFR